MKPETPKRLPPKLPVLRQLYLMSGNQCAYPNCEARLVDSNGAFVAQLCHIEGIGKTSQRFNPAQTNEQRRVYANLLFMCYEHHVLTNDEAVYTVAKLREIKANHEKRFSGIPSQMLNSIVDQTKHSQIREAKSLTKLIEPHMDPLTSEELSNILKRLHEFSNRLARLPTRTRELIVVIAERSQRPAGINMSSVVSVSELQHVTELSTTDLVQQIAMLDKSGLVRESFPDDFGQATVELTGMGRDWPNWDDLLHVTKKHGIALRDIVVNLRFDLLD
jgi:DNA-binding MarR family transcriptional regulator